MNTRARKKSAEEAVKVEKHKKIMARPVNPKTTSLYWMAKGRFNAEY
ncbi:MAG: hypothetical protein MK132_19425 [Lentisphaerales bacterium]|nr:hypothetical protein [Lentisphaerales bacterium]